MAAHRDPKSRPFRPSGVVKNQLLPEVEVDTELGEARIGGVDLQLTRTEFDVFTLLVMNAHRYVTQREILQGAFEACHGADSPSARRCIHTIRRKLDAAGRRAQILSKPGWGYRLVVASNLPASSGVFAAQSSTPEAQDETTRDDGRKRR